MRAPRPSRLAGLPNRETGPSKGRIAQCWLDWVGGTLGTVIANDFPLVQLDVISPPLSAYSLSFLSPLPVPSLPHRLPLFSMPGVVDDEQARRISKSIDDDLKVCFLDYVARFILPPPPARKRTAQETTETKEGSQRCVTSPLPLLVGPGLRRSLTRTRNQSCF